LIAAAERSGFDVMITTDQNLKYQQTLAHRKLAIIVLKTTSWPRIRNSISQITSSIQSLSPAEYLELEFE